MGSPRRHLVIVPAWNESASIAGVVAELRLHLPDFDVIVIDDGSTDTTLRAIPDDVTVVSLPFNLGIGGAMQTGYRYAALHGYDIAVQVDGDGQHPPEEVPKLLAPLLAGQADLVIGSRFLEPGEYRPSSARLIGIRVLNMVIRLLGGKKVTDCTSGFRAANRRVIAAFAHWYPEDYPEPEVILLLERSGYRVAEVPVRMKPRQGGRSSIPLLRGLFYVIKVAVALALDTMRQPWPAGKVRP